jgi:hypothetical protein
MTTVHHGNNLPPSDNPRDISRWAQAYAQHRSLGLVVFQVVFVVLALGIALPSYYGGLAYRSGNLPLFWLCLGVVVLAVAGDIFLSIPAWGGKQLERLVNRLYAKEGHVTLAMSGKQAPRAFVTLLVAGFGGCVVASVVLGFLGLIPFAYIQPVSALFVVPFLVALTLLMRPAVGYLSLLWPLLYGLHALLLLAGVPLRFAEPWGFLDILVPISGYGMLTGLIAHAYSRIALYRLRRLTRVPVQPEGEVECHD